MGGKLISTEEKRLVCESHNKEELAKKFIEKFGVPSHLSRIDNLWSQRDTIKQEMKPIVVAVGKTTQLSPKISSLPDEGETLVNISNKLSELIQIQKEQLELFRHLSRRETGETSRKDNGETVRVSLHSGDPLQPDKDQTVP